MRRAVEGFEALLDTKEAMPDEVTHPAGSKHEDTHEGECIAGRQSARPGGALGPMVNQSAPQTSQPRP
jgi:hypothetical protein